MQELAKSFSQLLDSLNGGAKDLAEAMQRVAPEAWRIAVRQVVIDAIAGLLTALAFAAVAYVVSRKFASNQRVNEAWAKEERDKGPIERDNRYIAACASSADGWNFAKWGAWCVVAVIMIASASSYIPDLLNPEYEAASQLSARFLGK